MPDFKNMHKFSQTAMATVFEVILIHENSLYARQAVQDVFSELELLEQDLSQFIENSDISRINRQPPGIRLRIGPDTYACLEMCKRLYDETDGLFDIAIGAMVEYWRSSKPTSQKAPEPERPFSALRHLELSLLKRTACMHGKRIHIDLGGIGKGYAVDQMSDLLQEWGFQHTLIHGGSSSVRAQEPPPEQQSGWPITIHHPLQNDQALLKLALKNQSLSGSGIRKGQHIINPKTGQPVSDRLAAWALAPWAALSDALSTAFMIMPLSAIQQYCEQHPKVAALVITDSPEPSSAESVVRLGDWGDSVIE